MPRSSLKVLRKPMSRCNISSPRYMRENHYAISCSVYEFLRFSNYKMSITLPFFKMSRKPIAYTAKLIIIFHLGILLKQQLP